MSQVIVDIIDCVCALIYHMKFWIVRGPAVNKVYYLL